MMACDGGKRQFQFISVYSWFADFHICVIFSSRPTDALTSCVDETFLRTRLQQVPKPFFPPVIASFALFGLFFGPTQRYRSSKIHVVVEKAFFFSGC